MRFDPLLENALNPSGGLLAAETMTFRYLQRVEECVNPQVLSDLHRAVVGLQDAHRLLADGMIVPRASECAISEGFHLPKGFSILKTACISRSTEQGNIALAYMEERDVELLLSPSDVAAFDALAETMGEMRDLFDRQMRVQFEFRQCLYDIRGRPFRLRFHPESTRTHLSLLYTGTLARAVLEEYDTLSDEPDCTMEFVVRTHPLPPALAMSRNRLLVAPSTEDAARMLIMTRSALQWCRWLTDLKGAAVARQIFDHPSDPEKLLVRLEKVPTE